MEHGPYASSGYLLFIDLPIKDTVVIDEQRQMKARLRVSSATRLGKHVGSRRRPQAIQRLATFDSITLPSDHTSTQFLGHTDRGRVLRKMAQALSQIELPAQGAVPRGGRE